jgi:uncharacterized membrane protein YraQ (UPF0718 family)
VIAIAAPSLAAAAVESGVTGAHQDRRARLSTLFITVLISGLIAYKGSAAIKSFQMAAAMGAIPASTGASLVLPGQTSSMPDAVARTAAYLALIGPALVFGILIAGAVRACAAPSWIMQALGRRPIRQQLVAGAAGAPLMLCSCCVAPVFSAVFERSRREGPSLAVALAAPSLNPAALALTFMMFRPHIAATRLALALIAVFVAAPVAARLAGPARAALSGAPPPHEDTHRCGPAGFVASCIHVALRVVPLIFAGVAASMWLVQRMPMDIMASGSGRIAAIALTSLIAVPIALPTFFEIPLALSLMSAGAPAGVAAAVLFAGPAINLPSLLAIGRATSWRLAGLAALAIGLLACVGGLLA